ncbi:hypothetical protein DUNSADRAFT_5117 [Dunaliella salina]|uniref:Uncharacterized protein n=1 Tax=Dunaliella salina TaxID=3046 RepID=A0ABQ7H7B8_DUNSA|nr:hypothetical protein DUNSADRAFT_5117 [Dunaliella salina]|eukprot:KAF5842746.1 hypothetical protein DUNSADRAFT_5117 [Dunaliella salina]
MQGVGEGEPAVLAKLEKLCRARGVPWTVAHYHAQEGEAVAAVAAESKAGAGDTSQPVVKEEIKEETTRTTTQSEATTPSNASTATPLPQQQLQQQQQQQQQQPSSRRPVTSTDASAAQQAATTATSAASQQTQLGGAGAQSQLGGAAGGRKVQAGGARKDAGGFKKRSEIDRRLDGLVGPSGRLKDASKQNIIKVLRMFNLCDIGPNQGRSRPLAAPERPSAPSNEDHAGASSCSRPTEASANGNHASALGSRDERSEVQGDGASNGDRIGSSEVNGPGPPISSGGMRGAWGGSDRQPPVMTARQRARMADLSLLLDVILKTTSATVKRDFVACGVLNQLQQHSAYGTFANILQELSTNQDYDVRTKAAMLLKKFPVTACQDPHLLQQLGIAPPRVRGPSGFSGFSPALPHLSTAHTNGPHMEIIFALGVYDRDWAAAGKRASKGKGRGVMHRGRKLGGNSPAEGVGGGGDSDGGGEDEAWGCPLSPMDHPPEMLSPVRPELCELEAEADARRLQQQQQRQLQQQGLLQGQGVGADGILLVMDLRTRATAAGHLGSYGTFSAQDMSGSGSGFMDVDPLQPALLAGTAAHAAHVVHSQGAIPEVSMDDAWQTNSVQGNGNAIPEPQEDPDIVEWTRSMPQDYPETWDEPDESFESFVSETVRYRLGKYVTLPDIASRVPSEDCHNLSRKIKREVIQKEKEAFEGRRVQGLFKLIERKKVQHNLYEFVRHSCKRWHAHKAEIKAQKQQQQQQQQP